jgi:N-acetylated-alpha-linked acidic dipeptidase
MENYGDPGFHRHVAVAKHLGLMALSLTDAIILPINTTQYAFELDAYLDKYVPCLHLLDHMLNTLHRVESIAATLSLSRSPNFHKLRVTIDKLQAASGELDQEKFKANEHFQKAFRRLEKVIRGKGACAHRMRRVRDSVKRAFGVDDSLRELHDARRVEEIVAGVWDAVTTGDEESVKALAHKHHHGHHDKHDRLKKAIKELMKAALRVRKVNQKLIAFERGFIDEAGIKDREWYRHLGVAPGKCEFTGHPLPVSKLDELIVGDRARLWRDDAPGRYGGTHDRRRPQAC